MRLELQTQLGGLRSPVIVRLKEHEEIGHPQFLKRGCALVHACCSASVTRIFFVYYRAKLTVARLCHG